MSRWFIADILHICISIIADIHTISYIYAMFYYTFGEYASFGTLRNLCKQVTEDKAYGG